MIDHDDQIPFWRAVGEAVHRHDCKFILQLSHSGPPAGHRRRREPRQKALSSTEQDGVVPRLRVPGDDARGDRTTTVQRLRRGRAPGARGGPRRRRAARRQRLPDHAVPLARRSTTASDEYGGSLENRARFLLEIVRAIRREVGRDFHLQMKISAVDHNNAVIFWEKKGNTLRGLDPGLPLAGGGGRRRHPRLDRQHVPAPAQPGRRPAGRRRSRTYDTMLSSGLYTFRNYLLVALGAAAAGLPLPLEPHRRGLRARGLNARRRRARSSERVSIPVICTGGFQTASVIREAIERGRAATRVTIARPLIANNDLVQHFAAGQDRPERPVHLLQQLPAERPREPARLLRAVALRRRPRPHDPRGHVGVPVSVAPVRSLRWRTRLKCCPIPRVPRLRDSRRISVPGRPRSAPRARDHRSPSCTVR